MQIVRQVVDIGRTTVSTAIAVDRVIVHARKEVLDRYDQNVRIAQAVCVILSLLIILLAPIVPGILILAPITLLLGYLTIEAKTVVYNMRHDLRPHCRFRNYFFPNDEASMRRYTEAAPVIRCLYYSTRYLINL